MLLALAAIAKAAVDVLTHAEGANIFEQLGPWWDARTSWKRKYWDYDSGDLRPRFWGSKTVLVALTDFWHLTDFVYLSAYLVGALLLGAALAGQPGWVWLVTAAGVKAGFGGVFEVFYRRVFRR